MGITIACIGSGNMGSALMRGAAGVLQDGIIGISDSDQAKAQALAKDLGGSCFASNTEAAEKGDYIFLAVKPQVLEEVLTEIAPVLFKRLEGGEDPVLVSMAAGWTMERLRGVLCRSQKTQVPRIVRIMPNTPALINQGMIVVCAPPELEAEKRADLERIFKAAGSVEYMEEKYLDMAGCVSGAGPAFVYMFIEALSDGGVRIGLPRDKAIALAAQTVMGSAAMVLQTGKHPGFLKDMVTSPGGTTIAGVQALENGCFRGTTMNAVEAVFKRNSEL